MDIPSEVWYGVPLQRRRRKCETHWRTFTTATSDGARLGAEAGGRSCGPENQLTERLDEDGQTILAKLIESRDDVESITARENFILGFRLGAKITMECMGENDGDIQEVTGYG